MNISSPLQVQASAELKSDLELPAIARLFWNCELKSNFGGYSKSSAPLVIRLKKPRSQVKLYSKGKLEFAGTCTVEVARICLKRVARRILQRQCSKPAIKFKSFKVSSVSWAKDLELGFSIDLLELTSNLSNRYVESRIDDSIPRVRIHCRSEDGKIVSSVAEDIQDLPVKADVFATGKLRVCSAKSEEELRQITHWLRDMLPKFRCKTLSA
eukprot:TRINITY_DN68588_c0_g1_i1.p1 TRINITY_DN68588_c0_g1~~TRINITY_DN68588_c0_g1_i1.p1  ORF type:complete len:212 (-),score=24.28 TRINITY_DN68588_c0_g1_i1:112-747(-)